VERFVFRYRNLDPRRLRPIGDRYLIEVLDVDEEKVGGIYLPEQSEEQKGWAVGVVFSIGNGHRLEEHDPIVVVPEGYKADPKLTEQEQMQRRMSALGYTTPSMGDESTVMRYPALVPMFFQPGEVIFVERYSGRQFTMSGRTMRFVSQVDCLGTSGMYLKMNEDGSWEERDLEAEAKAAAAAPNGTRRLHLS
jgi:co-chaperonin GroES (HSP10)